eukprot:365847-Chlamydomonas_euryale.AAC.1
MPGTSSDSSAAPSPPWCRRTCPCRAPCGPCCADDGQPCRVAAGARRRVCFRGVWRRGLSQRAAGAADQPAVPGCGAVHGRDALSGCARRGVAQGGCRCEGAC